MNPRRKEYNKRYAIENSESIRKQRRGFYKANRERLLEEHKIYYLSHKEVVKERDKKYVEKNRDKVSQRRSAYYQKNKTTIINKEKNKRETNINFLLASRIRIRMVSAIRGNSKVGSAIDDLGCTINELKFYLEGQFLPGMSWDNYGKMGWHIDHIIALSLFNLSDREQFLKACHYTNLQPLWAVDNLRKGAKIEFQSYTQKPPIVDRTKGVV